MDEIATAIPIPTLKRSACEHCEGKRRVWSATLRSWIACPRCRPRHQRLDTGALIELTQRAQPTAHEIIIALADRGRHYGLPPELAPTDRLLERWAVTQGSDDCLLQWTDIPMRSRPPPLPDGLAIMVDQIILHSWDQPRRLVVRWYLVPGESVTVLARSLGVHRDCLYLRWHSTLWYMRRRFLEWDFDV
jgi:hypothetical protein